MPSSTNTIQSFPLLPTLNGFDGFSSNGFGMPELGLTSLFDLDQSQEITKTSFQPTESMREPEVSVISGGIWRFCLGDENLVIFMARNQHDKKGGNNSKEETI